MREHPAMVVSRTMRDFLVPKTSYGRFMKTERRHELQTNILANWLGQQIEALKPYANVIGGAVIVVLLVSFAAIYIRNSQATQANAGWSDYYIALFERDIPRLRSVAEDHPGTVPALWARQTEADLELARGIESLFTIRQEARDALERAKDGYLEVEAGATNIPKLQYRAKFGLAKVHESLAAARSDRNPLDTPTAKRRLLSDVQGFLEDATRYYREVADGAPESSLRKQANDRLEALSKDLSAESWYTWFAQQTPAPPGAAAGGRPGFPDLSPNLGNLPDLPNFPIPGAADASPSGGSFPLDPEDAAKDDGLGDDSATETESETDATPEAPAEEAGESSTPAPVGEPPADAAEAPAAEKSDGS